MLSSISIIKISDSSSFTADNQGLQYSDTDEQSVGSKIVHRV